MRKPQQWDASEIKKFMIYIGPISSILSIASPPVLIMTAIIMISGLIIPFTGFGTFINLVPLPGTYFIWLVGILISYSLLTEVVKRWYIRRFNSWI